MPDSARKIAVAGLLCACLPVWPQFSREQERIDLRRLDVHPYPSLFSHALLHGAIDWGVFIGARRKASSRCGDSPYAPRFDSIGPSHLGWRGAERLDGGWLAFVDLESSFSPSHGTLGSPCGAAFDRAQWVGLGHRQWGRLDLGRQEQPAHAVTLMADPWAGTGVASPDELAYNPRPKGRDAAGQPLARQDVRAATALSYASPDQHPLRLRLQWGMQADPTPADRDHGASLEWRHGPFQLGLGYQRWNADTWTVPVAVVVNQGHWRWHAGASNGRLVTGGYRNLFIGASGQQTQGPRPGTWQVGLNLHQHEGNPTRWKLGAGRTWPLGRRTVLRADLGVSGHEAGSPRWRADFGIRHEFQLRGLP